MLRRACLLALLALAAACGSTHPAPLPGARPGARAPNGSERGLISYYADSLAGNRMANGVPYDPGKSTCAHRTYPFGTEISIVLDDTGETATCVVSDRGPFVRGRIVDVSKSVAHRLGLIKLGVARGRVEIVR